MKSIAKALLIFPILIVFISTSTAQYSAIELNVGVSRYLDDNLDREYEYTYWNASGMGQYNLGYSFPVSKKILLTPKIGVAFAKENYIRNTDSFFNFVEGDFTFKKNKNILIGRAGVESTYWLKPTFAGLFFSGELTALFMTSAKSERTTRTYNSSEMRFSEPVIENRSIKNQFHSIIPTLRLGIGYNLNFFTRLNFFAVTHLEYRPTGYYKNTKNISHFGRTLNLGVKYVIEGGTTILKKREKKIAKG
ncbi:MAG: hypothetical protein ACJATI_004429 [Halioglobus sp.]|jgi:hypothetical protein